MEKSGNKTTPKSNPNDHRFPSFSGNLPIGDDQRDEKHAFKPLFQNRPIQYAPSLPSRCSNTSEAGQDEKEKTCRLGFERGVEAGVQDAARLSKAAIEPNLVDFLQACESLSAFHQHLTETACVQIMEMAVKICEQIVSAPIHASADQLKTVQGELMDMMSGAHRLILHFHNDDLAALQGLTDSLELALPVSKAVEIRNEKAVGRGAPKALVSETEEMDMKKILTSGLDSTAT